MTAKHTPGPLPPQDYVHTEPNARLWDAAPDLLAACEELVADLESAYDDGQGARPTAVSATIHRAKQVIAKARGEA
jgi:hypothetical protein